MRATLNESLGEINGIRPRGAAKFASLKSQRQLSY